MSFSKIIFHFANIGGWSFLESGAVLFFLVLETKRCVVIKGPMIGLNKA